MQVILSKRAKIKLEYLLDYLEKEGLKNLKMILLKNSTDQSRKFLNFQIVALNPKSLQDYLNALSQDRPLYFTESKIERFK